MIIHYTTSSGGPLMPCDPGHAFVNGEKLQSTNDPARVTCEPCRVLASADIIIDPLPTAPYLTPERRLELILSIEHAERLGWMGDNFGLSAEGWRRQLDHGMSYVLDTRLEVDGKDAVAYVNKVEAR